MRGVSPEGRGDGDGEPGCMGPLAALHVLQVHLQVHTPRGLGAGSPGGGKPPQILPTPPAQAPSAACREHPHCLMLDGEQACIPSAHIVRPEASVLRCRQASSSQPGSEGCQVFYVRIGRTKFEPVFYGLFMAILSVCTNCANHSG